MTRITRNRKALSQPVTAMILLVVPVALAGGTVLYAYEIAETSMQIELLRLSNEHIWVFDNGTAFGAVAIDNIGGRDVVIDKIQVRGVEAQWSNVYYMRRPIPLATWLNCPNSTGHSWSSFQYTENTTAAFVVATTGLPLASGDTLIIFIVNPDNISLDDIGTTAGVTVFTRSAQYVVECNVQSAEVASQ